MKYFKDLEWSGAGKQTQIICSICLRVYSILLGQRIVNIIAIFDSDFG